MRQYNDKELMIAERKRAEKQLPHPGEYVQVIYFSILSAKEHFESAKSQFSQNMPALAINSFCLGLEELSKMIITAELLFSWETPEKVKEYKKIQTNHILKLKFLFDFFKKFFVSENDYVEINYKGIMSGLKERGILKKNIENNSLFKFLVQLVDEKQCRYELSFDTSIIAKKCHNLRLKATYIDFDGMTVKSPYHSLSKENIKAYKSLASALLEILVEVLVCLGNKFVPFDLILIRECYYSQDTDEIKRLKEEINRQVERTLPAIIFCMDNLWKTKTGKSLLDELTENDLKKINTDKIGKEELGKTWKKAVELIVSHQKIEDIYFYPPLKEEAKKYYSQFTQV